VPVALRLAQSNDVDGLELVLPQLGNGILMLRDRAMGSVLHYAAAHRSTEFLQTLAKQCDIKHALLNLKDAHQLTPADVAAANGYYDTLAHTVPLEHYNQQHKQLQLPLQYYKNPQDIKLKIILNPISGKGKSVRTCNEIVAPLLKLKGINFVVVQTEYSGHATEIARETCVSGEYDCIVAVGGDGTLIGNTAFRRVSF
jgi:hypothetical protein